MARAGERAVHGHVRRPLGHWRCRQIRASTNCSSRFAARRLPGRFGRSNSWLTLAQIWKVEPQPDNSMSVTFLAEMGDHTGTVNVVRFSPDGALRVCRVARSSCMRHTLQVNSWLRAATVSWAGAVIVDSHCVFSDRTICIWKRTEGTAAHRSLPVV